MNERFKDDYKLNSMLRKNFRSETKQLEKKGLLFGDSESKVALKELDDFDMVYDSNQRVSSELLDLIPMLFF